MNLLSVKNLQTNFYTPDGVVKAVNNVSFDIKAGEAIGIVGESGSGKSVTCLSLMQLIPNPPGEIVGGEAWFGDQDLLKLTPQEMEKLRGNQISMIFQDPMTSLNPFLKISRQLTEVLETHQGMNSKEALSKSIEMLDLVGIPSAAKRVHDYPHQFSGGMRQRVMIAMALLCQPKLLIADEPTTALDVTIQAQILDLIKGLRTELGTTVILITHDLGVVAGMCEHIAVMYAGRIIEYGRTADIFANPKHPYTIGLLKSVPRLDETEKARLDPIKGSPPDLTRLPSGCPFRTRCDYAIDKCVNSFPTCEKFDNEHFSFCWKANEL